MKNIIILKFEVGGIMYKVCIIVINDKGYTGEEEDISGKVVEDYLKNNKYNIALYSILPETEEIIKRFLIKCCDKYGVDLIITLGKTSIANEVSRDIDDRDDRDDLQKYNYAGDARGPFAFRGNTAIINLPYKLQTSQIPLDLIEKVLKSL